MPCCFIHAKYVSKTLRHDEFSNTLKTCEKMNVTINNFEKRNHQIYTTSGQKIALSAFDDKRYICDDGITTMAYGSHHIPKIPQGGNTPKTPTKAGAGAIKK